MSRDTIFTLPQQRIGEFAFDQQVVEVFPDMIARSVPGYASVLAMIQQLTARYARSGTALYDLGCSLGAATQLMNAQAPPDCDLHAVDNAPAMIQRLREVLQQLPEGGRQRIQIHESDIRDVPIETASLVVLNWTLQFVPPQDRPALLQRIFDGLVDGGALLISEKICFADEHQQQLLTELHHDFKRAHGYSDLEIAQKRSSLENILVPETLTQHCARLRDVGFGQVVPWFQCFNFVSILAVKLA
ncbi:MAG: carboxy-S-adenosyl-L-methionine synthase CmoA [Pirellulaceae bacterium]|nr:carboxy-S-adenosyl-L-methionine synthase CmoA [Pirellulaceae bacterium]